MEHTMSFPEIKVFKYKKWDVHILEREYANGRIVLQLIDAYNGSLIATATVNLPHELIDDDEMCIKDYTENEGMLKFLVDNNIVHPPHLQLQSGFVQIPVVRLVK
jgi:hypothetical protein